MDNRKLGKNMQKLLAVRIAQMAVPKGGGFLDGLSLFLKPGLLEKTSREGLALVDQAIEAIRATPDNPYGDDEEAIAEAILRKMGEID